MLRLLRNVGQRTARTSYQTNLTQNWNAGGSLGPWYYPTNGSLFTLVNAGSQSATSASLYHYTTQTNQAKESSSQADIGFHYSPCFAGSAVPCDTDNDRSVGCP